MVFRLHECKLTNHPDLIPHGLSGATVYLLVDLPQDRYGLRCFVGPGLDGDYAYLTVPRSHFELVGERPGHDFIDGRIEPRRPTMNPAPPTRL